MANLIRDGGTKVTDGDSFQTDHVWQKLGRPDTFSKLPIRVVEAQLTGLAQELLSPLRGVFMKQSESVPG